jgi:hypothetical protein
MVLPFAFLPESYWNDEDLDPTQEQTIEYLTRWPEDTWRAAIGCPSCGKVLPYARRDVDWSWAPFQEEGRYSSDTNCYRIELECARKDCRLPAKFHTVLNDQIPTESGLLDKLHRGFFGGTCPAGHDLLPIPKERYRVTRILDAIPTDEN